MKYLSIAVVIVLTAFVEAVTFSSLATVTLTLLSNYKPVSGFFGFFRRRANSPIEEKSTAPQGPVQFPANNFPQAGGFFNQFTGGNAFFPSRFQNAPGFPGGMFQGNRFPQSWFSPSRPQSGQFSPEELAQSQQFSPEDLAQLQSGQFPSQNQGFQSESGGFDREVRYDEQPQINTEEAESFFTLLAETDENKCISRLVCEMGADPSSAGELGTTISEIIGSLTDFPDGSKVSEYNQVLQNGRTRGLSACLSLFSSCDEESYSLMKNSQSDDDAA